MQKKKNNDAHIRSLWIKAREELGMSGNKFGIPAKTYLNFYKAEGLGDKEQLEAMKNFLTDPWWTEHKVYQDLAHFIKNYTKFMPDAYNSSKKKYTVERE